MPRGSLKPPPPYTEYNKPRTYLFSPIQTYDFYIIYSFIYSFITPYNSFIMYLYFRYFARSNGQFFRTPL